ncbi:MAG: glycerophosphodiester phosphodiesterase [Rubrivivax sp.]|nr:glycerophosphodiester phosphodiesterase [Rubrivivax sp.]
MAQPDGDWPLPFWVAHRGAGKLAPENTLAAFRAGAAHGYRAFECDVKLSADGVPFLLHDTTLDRTTSARGNAGDRTWAELSRLDAGGWHSRSYAGEPLPSLDTIAAYVQRNGLALNVEIKPTPGQERQTGKAVATACAALWNVVADGAADATADAAASAAGGAARRAPLLLSSFQPESLAAAQQAAPALMRALLVDTLWDGWWAAAQALGCVAVISNYRLMDAALIAQLHGAGLRALCYTVNEPADAERLLALGIDGLITDAVDRFAPAAPLV